MPRPQNRSINKTVDGLDPNSEVGREWKDLFLFLIALGYEESKAKSKVIRIMDVHYEINSTPGNPDPGEL